MIFTFFYDLILLLLGLIALPKILWQWLRHGKYKESLKARLGLQLPSIHSVKTGPLIWMHMVSVGETRAASSLFEKLQQALPDARVVISSTTKTGHDEAKRTLRGADSYFFLPLDLSWIIKKVMKRLRPSVLILVESDFWYHLLKEAKEHKAALLLVNGKVSERSYARFKFFRSFSRRLFGLFDLLCLQSERYKERFELLCPKSVKLAVTGNLKLDASIREWSVIQQQEFKQELGIKEEDRVLCLASTHEGEEEALLTALDKVAIPFFKILLVPRHPERFSAVKRLLESKGCSFAIYSQDSLKKGDEKILLIDAMGKLSLCYKLSEIAIVGGSFIQGVGGHNIFEAVQQGVPVLFGPHMQTQLDLVDMVSRSGAGKQVGLENLSTTVTHLLDNKEEYKKMTVAASQLCDEVRGSTERTWQAIRPFFKL